VGTSQITRRKKELVLVCNDKPVAHPTTHPPFVVIKADSGSYGMGVMTVTRGDDIRHLNRKQRTRMAATKEGQKIRRVILLIKVR